MGLKGLCIGLVLGIIIGIVNFYLKIIVMKKLEEVGLVPLSKKECVEQFGGLDNMWEVLGYIWGKEYASFKRNNFAPSVLPYK